MHRLFFLVLFFTILTIKKALYFLPIILVLWIASKNVFLKINKRVVLSILLFNSAITIGYIIISYIKGLTPWDYLIYINLKVYTISYFVILFFSKVNIVRFFEFSKDLSYILTISLTMIYSYIKTFNDFKLAIKARGFNEDFAFIKRVFYFFLTKAISDSKERSLAMKARGFFDD